VIGRLVPLGQGKVLYWLIVNDTPPQEPETQTQEGPGLPEAMGRDHGRGFTLTWPQKGVSLCSRR
jgi:hypothetical protein